MRYVHCWSGGKDSTAAIILDHLNGLPPSEIVFSEVMFDKTRGISGEHPVHIEFIYNTAIPRFEEWGYTVKVLHAEKDYIDCFHHVIENSKVEERIGLKTGFPLSGMCVINRDLKIKPIRNYVNSIKGRLTEYVGIAVDEPERLIRLDKNKISLLQKFSYTERMARDLCLEQGLLSPVYNYVSRNGCWFCMNGKYKEFAYIKRYYPELWDELRKLSEEDNLVTKKFKRNETFAEVDAKVDWELEQMYWEERQITLWD